MKQEIMKGKKTIGGERAGNSSADQDLLQCVFEEDYCELVSNYRFFTQTPETP
tara:strand:- start:19944 stop:20102 length:159 start_codon:yes stop_codon:yes gene_type:complete